jgi:hypothetical protein
VTSSLVREILGTAYLLLPLLGGAALHGICMKYGWLAFLARPIDGGRRYRGRPVFGYSKTFRGPVLLAVGTPAVFTLQPDHRGLPAGNAADCAPMEDRLT